MTTAENSAGSLEQTERSEGQAHPQGADFAKLPSSFKQRVLILGAGISGLSVANQLLKKGKYDVTHWSDRPVSEMTSSKAAAYWLPCCAGGDKIPEWSERTFAHLAGLAQTTPDAGVTMKLAREFHRTEQAKDPDWAPLVDDFRHATKGELPKGFVDAYFATVPVAHTRFYLAWLMAQNAALGAKIETRKVQDIEEAFERYDIAVNCTGMGSSEIGGIRDKSLVKVRGQLVRIKRIKGIDEILMDEGGANVTYLCPRTAPDPSKSDVVLGGTFERGNDSMEPDPETAKGIIERCAQFHPSIRGAKILGHVVGLRPLREKGIRVEAEKRAGGKLLVHNYGHGGSGFTVSEGCANDVVQFIEN